MERPKTSQLFASLRRRVQWLRCVYYVHDNTRRTRIWLPLRRLGSNLNVSLSSSGSSSSNWRLLISRVVLVRVFPVLLPPPCPLVYTQYNVKPFLQKVKRNSFPCRIIRRWGILVITALFQQRRFDCLPLGLLGLLRLHRRNLVATVSFRH